MADTLMNIRPKEIEINNKLELDDLLNDIRYKFSEREYKRILLESLTFQKFLDYKKDLDCTLFFLKKQDDLKREQKSFLNKFDVFMKYIKGETNNRMNLKFSAFWKVKFDPIFDKENIFEHDEIIRRRTEENDKNLIRNCI
jgi:hypothetical protein